MAARVPSSASTQTTADQDRIIDLDGSLQKSRKTRVIEALVIAAIVFITATIGSRATIPNIPEWYEGLIKPSFNPPNWIFGPVWTLLYAVMTYAAWRVFGRLETQRDKIKFSLVFIAQLFFNALWSIVFFGMHNPAVALLVFAKYDRTAAFTQLPYAAWVAFASLLNLAIVLLNPA
jgi:tryptophan-rich sensory protein